MKSSISLSGQTVDGLALTSLMEKHQAKKENVSYGKAVSSQCFRAHQQRHDLIVVALGHKGREFLTAHDSRAEKWQADRDPHRNFCPGSETLPCCHVRGRELGEQPAGGGRRGHPCSWTEHRKYSRHRTGARVRGTHFSRSGALWPPRYSHPNLSRIPRSLRLPLSQRHRALLTC